ncbi:hypothetical protein HPB50_007612 [Hyalomma asiaticum]|uniref:Uncharacterized protein n=1 Tax=Hyalomma asiaticum TaxID=266040 RepID=A0ACB7SBP9_HYAAI|nr:hypothetical protein HPB50_007612 [Hyalomma asiaticum]
MWIRGGGEEYGGTLLINNGQLCRMPRRRAPRLVAAAWSENEPFKLAARRRLPADRANKELSSSLSSGPRPASDSRPCILQTVHRGLRRDTLRTGL